MKIVILDSETVSRGGDVSLDGITSLGEAQVYGYTPNEEVADKIGDADAVICNKCLVTEEVFEKCKNLKYVGLFATGYNNVDLKAADRHGAVVCNVPAYSTDSVAQHTFALILNHFNKIRAYADTVDNGDWVNYKLFTYFYIPTYELKGMTIGIVGYGSIGRRVAEIARVFGMKVLTFTRSPEKVGDGAEAVSLDRLLRESDVVTMHCPLTDTTREMINKDALAKMKPTAYFVNTARGGVVNEQELADALNEGVIAGAGIDTLTFEPMREDCPLRNAKNITITPHIAWAPKQTRERLLETVAENLRKWRDGQPQNVVNNR
ncbi:D-2-hydroxyacid dehydrogenase [Ruminococcus albus]|uniref:Putative glycerate dehydrogenase n=1 Tax=Ruminococcus albus 8 TaxID=246199 RepID=E9SCD5_RUMAL|nr:D-2-hydroxyacid dehydrogenase [Ruminococcus albus]EGC03039.1 putative glycerate dehydrogenase [Ruminococcus albus 8]MCC3352296.1 D-2-hydroxyacid dehydrogenase [Ruminococcus albus 8]